MDKVIYWIWLSICFSIGSGKPQQLVEEYDPVYIYNNREEICSSVEYLTDKDKTNLRKTSIEKAESIYKSTLKHDVRVVTYNDDEYPKKLKHIYSAPIVLYIQGDISYLNDSLAIAMVGTRKCTDYGKKVTGNLSYVLSLAGSVIVSGCAEGIDEFAHRGAVKARAKTVGVLGCGHNINYPSKTAQVRKGMLMCGGALISEIPPNVRMSGSYFPTRNRIIAGLSDGVIVTEAPVRSGSLITARYAGEMNRDIFCVPPCNVFDKAVMGVAPLLRDGAKAVFTAMDILEDYAVRYEGKIDIKRAESFSFVEETKDFLTENEPLPVAKKNSIKETPEGLTDRQMKVYTLLSEEPVHVDEVTQKSGMACFEVLSVLTELELIGAIKAHSGRRYSIN